MNMLKQVFTAVVVTHLVFFPGCGLGVHTGEDSATSSSSSSPSSLTAAAAAQDQTDSAPSKRAVRQKRAPGWGKRSDEDFDAFSGADMLDDSSSNSLDEAEDFEVKRAPGWGKRDFEADKRAPGWGKRAPGWGKRAPGWGKRAPGWGKRAPGWGKRAPGWGKRAPGWGKRSAEPTAEEMGEEEDKRAPGWGKRAPGWGKRAPGWGKRAPGWGKRSVEGMNGECKLWNEELDFFLSRAIETEARLQAMCGSSPAAFDLTTRK